MVQNLDNLPHITVMFQLLLV